MKYKEYKELVEKELKFSKEYIDQFTPPELLKVVAVELFMGLNTSCAECSIYRCVDIINITKKHLNILETKGVHGFESITNTSSSQWI